MSQLQTSSETENAMAALLELLEQYESDVLKDSGGSLGADLYRSDAYQAIKGYGPGILTYIIPYLSQRQVDEECSVLISVPWSMMVWSLLMDFKIFNGVATPEDFGNQKEWIDLAQKVLSDLPQHKAFHANLGRYDVLSATQVEQFEDIKVGESVSVPAAQYNEFGLTEQKCVKAIYVNAIHSAKQEQCTLIVL